MPKTRNIRRPAVAAPPVKADADEQQASGSSKPSARGKASPVKRAASLVPFPTPPRTTHKRKRARSRITDSDSEEDERALELPSIDEEDREDIGKRDGNGALILGYKKRKTLDAIAEELSEAQVEEAFWVGESGAPKAGESSTKSQGATRGRQRSRSPTRSPSSSPPPAPHLLRRQHTGLASPPPSRRQPRTHFIRNIRTRRQTTPPAPAPPPPAPSETRVKKQGLFPTRDTPDNPFLSDDSPGPSRAAAIALEAPRTPERVVEKPTVTWVFRGKRVELANPHYKSPGVPDSPTEAASLLPETHPDYSPPATYAPKLLFPGARRDLRKHREPSAEPRTPTHSRGLPSPGVETRSQTRARSRSRAATVDSDDEETELPQGKMLAAVPEVEENEVEVDEAALQAAMAKRLAQRIPIARTDSIGRASTSTATYEPPRTRARARAAPRLPEKDSDPARRAMGPARPVKG